MDVFHIFTARILIIQTYAKETRIT